MVAYNTAILCASPADRDAQLAYAERQRVRILHEIRDFYRGNIDIRIAPELHTMGWSITADLIVSGEICRHYDPADLCFLDLNELMLQRMLHQRSREDNADD